MTTNEPTLGHPEDDGNWEFQRAKEAREAAQANLAAVRRKHEGAGREDRERKALEIKDAQKTLDAAREAEAEILKGRSHHLRIRDLLREPQATVGPEPDITSAPVEAPAAPEQQTETLINKIEYVDRQIEQAEMELKEAEANLELSQRAVEEKRRQLDRLQFARDLFQSLENGLSQREQRE